MGHTGAEGPLLLGIGPILVRSQHSKYSSAFLGSSLSVLFSLISPQKGLLVPCPCLDCVFALAQTCDHLLSKLTADQALGVGWSSRQAGIHHLRTCPGVAWRGVRSRLSSLSLPPFILQFLQKISCGRYCTNIPGPAFCHCPGIH